MPLDFADDNGPRMSAHHRQLLFPVKVGEINSRFAQELLESLPGVVTRTPFTARRGLISGAVGA
jgi:hypothetical protein